MLFLIGMYQKINDIYQLNKKKLKKKLKEV